jgi:hypothetical protein
MLQAQGHDASSKFVVTVTPFASSSRGKSVLGPHNLTFAPSLGSNSTLDRATRE